MKPVIVASAAVMWICMLAPAGASYTLPLKRVKRTEVALLDLTPVASPEVKEAIEKLAEEQSMPPPAFPDQGADVTRDLPRSVPGLGNGAGLGDVLSNADPLALMADREALIDVADSLFMIDVELGSPRRPIRLIVDTGSSDLWVSMVSGHFQDYNATRSSTARVFVGQKVAIQYGKGKVSGYAASDNLCLEEFCLKSLKLVIVTRIAELGGSADLFDGILGLGFPGLMRTPLGSTFLDQMMSNGAISHLGFGMQLGTTGSISFGNVEELVTEAQQQGLGDSFTLPIYGIRNKAYWWLVKTTVSMPGFTVLHWGILDSGSSLITLPSPVYDQAVDRIVGKEHFKGPSAGCSDKLDVAPGVLFCTCDIAKRMKPLTFLFTSLDQGEVQVTLQASDLYLEVGLVCRINLMRFDSLPVVILGDTFLRKFYTVYDYAQKKAILFRQGPPSDDLPSMLHLGFFGMDFLPSVVSIMEVPLVLLALFGVAAVAFAVPASRRWAARLLCRRSQTVAIRDEDQSYLRF